MAQFTEIPNLTIGKKGEWILAGSLVYESDRLIMPVIVPEGFITNLASIPLFPKDGDERAPAIVHDYLYHTQSVSRKLADRIFLEAMIVKDVSKIRRNLLYAGLRIYSWWPFK